MTTRLALPVLLALALAAVGCASNSHALRGKVVPGRTGVVTAAAPNDQRLEQDGISGVLVRVMRGGVAPVAEATSGPTGEFTLRLSEDDALSGRVEIVASGPGILTTRGAVYPPTDDRWLLIYAEPASPPAGQGAL